MTHENFETAVRAKFVLAVTVLKSVLRGIWGRSARFKTIMTSHE